MLCSATCLCRCSAPLPPSLCANTTAPQQPLKTDIGIEARGDIIAYRRSGLVQRRALLRVGRRIAPCLLCQHSAPHVHFAPTPDCPSDLRIATLQPKFLYNFTSLCGIIDVTQYYSYNTPFYTYYCVINYLLRRHQWKPH